MPSLRTRIRYQEIVVGEAAEVIVQHANTLEDLEAGTLDLDAVTVGGQRFINSGGALVVEP